LLLLCISLKFFKIFIDLGCQHSICFIFELIFCFINDAVLAFHEILRSVEVFNWVVKVNYEIC
jgi:hypothetical protein